jgi:hypothetical protein
MFLSLLSPNSYLELMSIYSRKLKQIKRFFFLKDYPLKPYNEKSQEEKVILRQIGVFCFPGIKFKVKG